MARYKPYCQSGLRWIAQRLKEDHHDPHALAALTGQDARALSAFLHLVALYGNSDGDGRAAAVQAMACTVLAMQPKTRYIAKAGIPHVLDWSDEEHIWNQILVANAGRT